MTRKSTQKHEVATLDGMVIVSGKSRTACEAIAREMNKGVPAHRHVIVQPAR